MKRLIFTLFVMTLSLTCNANEKVDILAAFDKEIINDDNAIETIIEGKSLNKYGLKLYRSISVTKCESIEKLQTLIKQLSHFAIEKEESLHNGDINYAFYEFAPTNKTNRFAFFFNNKNKALFIYMEGNTTIENIKSLIKK